MLIFLINLFFLFHGFVPRDCITVEAITNPYYKIQSSNFPYFYMRVLGFPFIHYRVCSIGDGWTVSSNTNSYWYYQRSEIQHGIRIYILCSGFIDCPDPNMWLTRIKTSGQREAFRPSYGVYASCDALTYPALHYRISSSFTL